MALWGGRFTGESAADMTALSRSVQFDWRLAKYDVCVNLAHVEGLVANGIINSGNGEVIKAGLKAIAVEIEKGTFKYIDADEDVHSAIERTLVEKIGSVGSSIRAGRSRNDLVATDFKLYLIDNLNEIASLVSKLVESINLKSGEQMGVIAPGFTHLQHAQPILFSHELLKHSHALLRDISRINDWLNRNSKSPFGSGALSGSPLQPNPELIAEALGFESVIENSIDGVSDRDYVSEALFILAQIGIHLSRIGEEFVIWNSSEFNWVTLDDKFSTGSSIMPQKKNPDVAELARGKAGRLIGNLTGLLATTKNLAFAYNRDLQEDKEPVFDSVETLQVLLPAITGMIATAKFNQGVISAGAINGFSLATEIADELAKTGVPFAEAHEISGKCVKYCETNGKFLETITAEDLSKIDTKLPESILSKLSAKAAINSRTSSLATSEASVKSQLNLAIEETRDAQRWISNAIQSFSGMMSL
jgi:argininosuccinate lyase